MTAAVKTVGSHYLPELTCRGSVRACARDDRYLGVGAPGDGFHHDGLVFLLNLEAVVLLLGVNLLQGDNDIIVSRVRKIGAQTERSR